MPTNLTGFQINSTYRQILHISDGPTATEKTVFSGTGVATALRLGTTSMSGTFSSIAFTDQAAARVSMGLGTMSTQNANSVAITGGTLTNVTFSGSFSGITLIDSDKFTTKAGTDGISLQDNSIFAEGVSANLDISLTPKGTGSVNITKVNIDAGTIDGTTVGETVPASIHGTTIEATTSIGYPTGAGGAVTQATSRTTGVTLNKITGQITLFAGTLGGHDADEFTLTNSAIGANDVIVLGIKNGCAAGTRKYYQVHVVAQAAGSCVISVGNIHNTAVPSTGTDSPVLQFAVIKGAIA
jgi:hypothetical protein